MKKRILAGLMAGSLLFGSAALADIDLSDMSYNELADLYADVHAEMITRSENVDAVASGVYQAGRDIPAGRYRLEFKKSSSMLTGLDGFGGLWVTVYSDSDVYKETYEPTGWGNGWKGSMFSSQLTADGDIVDVALEDGNVLVITDGQVNLSLLALYD